MDTMPTIEPEQRVVIGRKLGLNVGKVNERAFLKGSTEPVQVRDDLGMLLDPKQYARNGCATCYGEGVSKTMHPVTSLQAAKLIRENPANEARLHKETKKKREKVHTANGKPIWEDRLYVSYWSVAMVMCDCARRRYKAQRATYLGALKRAGLPTAGVRP